MHLPKPSFRRFAWLAVLAVLLQLGLSAAGGFAHGAGKDVPWADDLCLSVFSPNQTSSGDEAPTPMPAAGMHCPLCAVSTPPPLADYLAVFLFALTQAPTRVQPVVPQQLPREPLIARLPAPRAPPIL